MDRENRSLNRKGCQVVKERESLLSAASALAKHVLSGGNTEEGIALAVEVEKLCEGRGVYVRKYDDPVERVLMRHLNLYKNKLAKARTDADKTKWREKLREQNSKIEQWKYENSGGRIGLDLDGL